MNIMLAPEGNVYDAFVVRDLNSAFERVRKSDVTSVDKLSLVSGQPSLKRLFAVSCDSKADIAI